MIVGDDDAITKACEHGIVRDDAVETRRRVCAQRRSRRDSYTSLLSHCADGRSDNDNRQHERKEAWFEAQLSGVVIEQGTRARTSRSRLDADPPKATRRWGARSARQEDVAQVESVKRSSHLVALEQHESRLASSANAGTR